MAEQFSITIKENSVVIKYSGSVSFSIGINNVYLEELKSFAQMMMNGKEGCQEIPIENGCCRLYSGKLFAMIYSIGPIYMSISNVPLDLVYLEFSKIATCEN